ncbi:hypothetical protein PIB30_060459 [Stylosanthes scabra]|uniref:FLZ-type domain-containing protein n=1 Tax=Stylosanthes scabra TaxID=79078 RepID=A0ABU6QLA0_9FABA|nr:hypothetical protein [Stylosanthes scabra]
MYTSTARPSYFEQDHGLASLKDMESGSGGCSANGVVSRSMTMGYGYATSYSRTSHRNLSSSSSSSSSSSLSSSSVSSPRSGRFYDARFEDHQPHFLQACFLCKKPLSDNRDIFMYRGDTPFCSEECREEQIEIDEEKEKKKSISSSMKALRNKEQAKSGYQNKARGYSFRTTGAVAAA